MDIDLPLISPSSIEAGYVPFDVINGLIIVNAQYQGKSGHYILDTGSPRITLNRPVNKKEFVLQTVRRELEADEIQLSNFRLGNLEIDDQLAWRTDLSFLESNLEIKIDGILGNNMIGESTLFIDYEKHIMGIGRDNVDLNNINSASYHIVSLPIKGKLENIPIVEIEIDGVPKKMAFDTGAALNVLFNSETGDHKDVSIGNVRIEKMIFQNSMVDLFQNTELSIDGILSVNMLNASKLVIDQQSSRIHLFWLRT